MGDSLVPSWYRDPDKRLLGGKWFSFRELDILTSQALSLREAGKRNDEIADILHISYAVVRRLIGKMPKELRKPTGPKAGLTAAEREQRRVERLRRWSAASNASAKRDNDIDLLRRRLAAYAIAELHASTNEGLAHDPSDIVAAVEAEMGGVVEWNGHGLRRRASESDDVEWRDEADVMEEWPEPKSDKYYATYRHMVLEDRRCAEEAKRRGYPKFMSESIALFPLPPYVD